MKDERLLLLNKTIKELRNESGLTQREVAHKMGITYQSYQAYELGITIPTLKNFCKLCDVFDVKPNDLLEI